MSIFPCSESSRYEIRALQSLDSQLRVGSLELTAEAEGDELRLHSITRLPANGLEDETRVRAGLSDLRPRAFESTVRLGSGVTTATGVYEDGRLTGEALTGGVRRPIQLKLPPNPFDHVTLWWMARALVARAMTMEQVNLVNPLAGRWVAASIQRLPSENLNTIWGELECAVLLLRFPELPMLPAQRLYVRITEPCCLTRGVAGLQVTDLVSYESSDHE